ncbi:S1/P1 Nuclease [Chitinophaga sp. CF118]|uniref:zinc dependent phospholipase C family protein n=1 Tax=Chitinophaga sp. CF118 TaxID=1884367 RepID=UPI0008E356A3|nr:zinc dependent phospholipase C family protein [Chitinophaga sp. CF118]SFE28211.1 S1/P1 Nuclease [Chitinophaga sp. CF118]
MFLRLFVIMLIIFFPISTKGWGFFAHQRINRLAVFLLPPEMIALYKPQLEYLTNHATDADKRRYIVAAEGPRHYIDIDHYREEYLPVVWRDAVTKFSEDTLNTYGILPWHISHMMARLTKAFQEKNSAQIMKLSADLGHYIADAHVPLHACSNHNGQFTGQQGIHGLWESRIPELLADQAFNYWAGKAVYIRDIQATTWQIVRESAMAADTVLKKERTLSIHFPTDQRYAYENRSGKLVRTYSTAYTRAYQQVLGNMVERRMCGAIFMISSFWYTAWVNAGMPHLGELDAKIFLKEKVLPVKDKMIGRQEE